MKPHPSPITVLICDDDVGVREWLRAIVDNAAGMRVVGEAADGEAAIQEAIRQKPDVILLDLAMPILSGIDALPRLKEIGAAAKIIVLTGFSTATAAEEVLALGADTYLTKGANAETLIAAIRHVVVGATTP